MTTNKNLKRAVRDRAAKTGESYTTARRHVLAVKVGDPARDDEPGAPLRLAVAQTVVRGDPGSGDELRASGVEIRRLMRRAHDGGARVIHFGEGATCWPDTQVMSIEGPDVVGPADWDRADWAVLHDELARIAALAAELRLWTVVGAVHRLTRPHRPHNSLYVISDEGVVVTRYDERMLSNTKLQYLYSPGAEPVTFEVDGVRFGCALGMEVHFPELFLEYERLEVDAVLVSTVGVPATWFSSTASDNRSVLATEAQAHASTNSYWVSYASAAQDGAHAPAGVIAPDGRWVARCPQETWAAIVTVDLDDGPENLARPWRRTVRAGIYETHLVDDPRSTQRAGF